ncbi:hypothetical protein Pelo_13933 [Pelomyxa schiedti]|nr:hypothetical protein Pelo_13933 [Pelomyxa schiedti]
MKHTAQTKHKPRSLRAKEEKFEGNVTRRGMVDAAKKEKSTLGVGPIVIGFLLFVVVGSAILQIVRSSI